MSDSSTHQLRIGVLALQGAFIEHIHMLQRLAVKLKEEGETQLTAFEVRTAEDLSRADGLIIPGGESTSITKLLQDDTTGLVKQLQSWIQQQKPIFGTCAGSILLSNRIVTAENSTGTSPTSFERDPSVLLGGIHMTMARNWYGRQLASFQCDDLVLNDTTLQGGEDQPKTGVAIFIRAPAVVDIDPKQVQILATLPQHEQHRRTSAPGASSTTSTSHAVAVREGSFLATCFHPELSQDLRWHRYFVKEMCRKRETESSTTQEK